MSKLSPKTLCRLYTLAEIETKITFYMEQLEGATVRMYDKDSSQGRQKVESADIEKIESLLQTWLAAKECKTGVGGVQVVSQNFRTNNRGGVI